MVGEGLAPLPAAYGAAGQSSAYGALALCLRGSPIPGSCLPVKPPANLVNCMGLHTWAGVLIAAHHQEQRAAGGPSVVRASEARRTVEDPQQRD